MSPTIDRRTEFVRRPLANSHTSAAGDGTNELILIGRAVAAGFFNLQATGKDDIARMFAPLTAHQAYLRTVELKRRGFTEIVAIHVKTGRRISEVERLLRDLEA